MLGVATGFITVYAARLLGEPIACWPRATQLMDKTKPTTAPSSTNHKRLAGLLWSATRGQAPFLAILILGANAIWILPTVFALVRGEPVGLSLGDIVFVLTFALVFGFFGIFVFSVVPSVLMEWFEFYEWARSRRSEKIWKKIDALGDAHKAPFHLEQRCKLSPTKEVWVRRVRDTQSDKLLLEVLHTGDSCQTWERLPLRLGPWARFKCMMHEEEWPPASSIRNLSCNGDGITFEVLFWGPDTWEIRWPNVWRATYRTRRKWWTLKIVGPLWPVTFSYTTGIPTDASRPKNA